MFKLLSPSSASLNKIAEGTAQSEANKEGLRAGRSKEGGGEKQRKRPACWAGNSTRAGLVDATPLGAPLS